MKTEVPVLRDPKGGVCYCSVLYSTELYLHYLLTVSLGLLYAAIINNVTYIVNHSHSATTPLVVVAAQNHPTAAY